MVTATNGTATFKDLATGESFQVDIYISDVVGANVTFSQTGLAGTGSDAFVRFDHPVVMTDLSIVTGPTVMVGLVPYSNGQVVNGAAYRIANFLNSIQTRPKIALGFAAGKNIQLKQF